MRRGQRTGTQAQKGSSGSRPQQRSRRSASANATSASTTATTAINKTAARAELGATIAIAPIAEAVGGGETLVQVEWTDTLLPLDVEAVETDESEADKEAEERRPTEDAYSESNVNIVFQTDAIYNVRVLSTAKYCP